LAHCFWPKQKRLRETLERAIKVIVDSQNDAGGWRYDPVRRTADVSVTICQIMALRSARNAGITVPKSTVENCIKYVRKCQNSDGGFNYMANPPGPSAFARSAAGVCALYCAGVYEGKDIEKGLDYLRRTRQNNGFNRMGGADMHYYYGQYYAAQAMWTAGGDLWKEWFPAARDELLKRSGSRADGIWSDTSTCADYATAMSCIILQIPNNYLPILQK
jgi:prenyltransferase beta subunit